MARLHHLALLVPLCLALSAAGCGVDLEHGLDERQANQVAALLEGHGIAVDKARDEGTETTGWKISVPRGELGRAFTLLEANDLPRRDRRPDALAERSLLPSNGEEQARLESARGAELERTLERIPGVLSARVHLALPDSTRLDAQPAPPRASVLLRTSGTLSVDEAALQRLVAGAVTGLSEQSVAIVIAGGATAESTSLLEPVGPLRVARGQRGRVVAFAASGLALLMLLGTALVLTAMRLASARGRDQSTASIRNG
ncbi:MAG: secretion protein [Polyangia bacterium]